MCVGEKNNPLLIIKALPKKLRSIWLKSALWEVSQGQGNSQTLLNRWEKGRFFGAFGVMLMGVI
jgi:hypothetical protein